jgi:nitrite reductase/ring-hydroxylating ferredoxin subunit
VTEAPGAFVEVGRLEDFPPETLVARKVGEVDVAVCNVDGRLHAFSNFCPHEAITLTSGYGVVFEGQVVCMMHTSVFDLESGEVLSGPAYGGLTKYRVKVENGAVYVAVDTARP